MSLFCNRMSSFQISVWGLTASLLLAYSSDSEAQETTKSASAINKPRAGFTATNETSLRQKTAWHNSNSVPRGWSAAAEKKTSPLMFASSGKTIEEKPVAATPLQASEEAKPLSATERVKLLLQERRRPEELPNTDSADHDSTASGAAEDKQAANPQIDQPVAPTSVLPAETLAGLTATDDPNLESHDPLKREKARRFLELKEQLQRLRSNRQSSNIPSPVEQRTSVNSEANKRPSSHGKTADPSSVTSPSEDLNHAASSHAGTEDHSSVSVGDHAVQSESSEHSDHTSGFPEVSASAVAVVDGPIDRLGLANNLYAIGDYRLSLEMYENADGSDMTAQQQMWAEYQAANCLRRMGRNSEASNRYRKLAAQPEAGWLSTQSEWWVETLERIRQFEKSIESDHAEQSKYIDFFPEHPAAQENSPAVTAEPVHDTIDHPAANPEELKHGEHHE